MTVSTGIATATLTWTGVETTFNPAFQAQNVGDVEVIYTQGDATEILTLGTHYGCTLDGAGNVTVTPIALPAAPATLTFNRNSTQLQADSFADGQPWSAEVIGAALDLGALRDQEIRRDLAAVATSSAALQAAITALIPTLMASWAATLPTVLPPVAGVWWNNGGAISLS